MSDKPASFPSEYASGQIGHATNSDDNQPDRIVGEGPDAAVVRNRNRLYIFKSDEVGQLGRHF